MSYLKSLNPKLFENWIEMGLWPDWLLLHLHINDDITFLLSRAVPVVDSGTRCFIHFKRHLLFFQIAAFLDNLPVVDLQSSLFCHFLLLLSCSLSCQWQLRDVNPPRKNHCQISHWLRSAQIWNSLHWIKIHIWILLIVWICCDDDFYFNLLCQMRECMKCLWELPVEGLGRRRWKGENWSYLKWRIMICRGRFRPNYQGKLHSSFPTKSSSFYHCLQPRWIIQTTSDVEYL